MKWIIILLSLGANGRPAITASTSNPLYTGGYSSLWECKQDLPRQKALAGNNFPDGMAVCLAIDPTHSESFVPNAGGDWVYP